MMSNIDVSFTPAAIMHIEKAIQEEGGGVFHLEVKQAGCSGYKYYPKIIKAPLEKDQPVELNPQLTVYVDSESLPFLRGIVVDYVSKGLGQQQMVFLNPNATSECGCGESFFVDGKAD